MNTAARRLVLALSLLLTVLCLPGCKTGPGRPASPPATAVTPSPLGEAGTPVPAEGMRPATSASPATPAQPPASTARPVPAQGLRRVHVFITGHVQGVGFRNFTQANAENLKLTGWVRNLSDGRVEAVVEGPPDAVAGLLKLLQRGPERAKVDQLDTTDQPPTGEFKSFQQLP